MEEIETDGKNDLKISCIMAVWQGDRSEFVSEAIHSVLSQSELTTRLFLGLDGPLSVDLMAVVNRARREKHVEVVQFEHRRGLASVLNDLIDLALADPETEFVARMDADDIARPQRFERQVQHLEANPQIDILGTCARKIDDFGNDLGAYTRHLDHQAIRMNAVWQSPCLHPTVVFRRKVLDQGWRYDEKQLVGQDYHLWVRLLANGCIFENLPDELLLYRTGREFYSKRSRKRIRRDVALRFFGMRTLNDYRIRNWMALFAVALVRGVPSLNRLKR